MEFRKVPEQFELLGDVATLEAALKDPLWYLSDSEPWGPIIDQYYLNPPEKKDKTEEWEQKKIAYTWFLAQKLEQKDGIALGDWPEYKNDDDRVYPPNMAVIHHTSSDWLNTPVSYIDALGLVRLYVPLFRANVWGENQPVSSGHFYKGRQVFVGYHWLIYEDGTALQILNDKCTGFQAGDLQTNKESVSFAYVGDLENSLPPDIFAFTVNRIIEERYPHITRIIGHKEVMHNGELVDTICPGNRWEEWKDKLIFPLQS